MENFLSNYHNPVLLNQSVEGLVTDRDGIYVDLTFGSGGHSRKILEILSEKGKLFAFDQDLDVQEHLINDSRFTFINHNFKFINNYLRMYNISKVDGILGDLGVSSHQFDTKERGFSIRFEGTMDMRMDTRKNFTAAQVLNEYDLGELKQIFWNYGQLQNAGKLAQLIVKERENEPFDDSQDFIRRIKSCIPLHREFKYLAQLYQALRIEVNDELNVLQTLLLQTTALVKPHGRLVMIAYHSLEDRLVKYFMRSGNFEDKIEKDMFGNNLSPWNLITKRAITVSESELQENNRSRSAKLRIAERRETNG